MNFSDAGAFVKKFPSCHPKIFRGFFEWGFGHLVHQQHNLSKKKGDCAGEIAISD
jgi:hypothetical protein